MYTHETYTHETYTHKMYTHKTYTHPVYTDTKRILYKNLYKYSRIFLSLLLIFVFSTGASFWVRLDLGLG
jgi:hypothetical protein